MIQHQQHRATKKLRQHPVSAQSHHATHFLEVKSRHLFPKARHRVDRDRRSRSQMQSSCNRIVKLYMTETLSSARETLPNWKKSFPLKIFPLERNYRIGGEFVH